MDISLPFDKLFFEKERERKEEKERKNEGNKKGIIDWHKISFFS